MSSAAVGLLLAPLGLCADDDRVGFWTADGRYRLALVHTPPDISGDEQLPVVLVLHGGGGNAAGTQASTGMDEIADQHGFIAVYPEGTGNRILGQTFATWNAGSCCGDAADNQVDDVGFIDRLLDRLERRYPIDPLRVYATGISNGAAMSQKLACDLADRIAAVAPIAGPLVPPDCNPSRPVPVLLIHGTADQCALYDGGEVCGGCWQRAISMAFGIPDSGEGRFPCQSAAEQGDFWATVNGCVPGDRLSYRRGDASCRRRHGCRAASVELCTIQDGGHTWPGTEYTCDPASAFCRAFMEVSGTISQDLDANRYMWLFFSNHPGSESPERRSGGRRVRPNDP